MKRLAIVIAVSLVCGIASARAEAQTPAQMAKFCRYLSTHPDKAMALAAAQGGPQDLMSYCDAAAQATGAMPPYTASPYPAPPYPPDPSYGAAPPYPPDPSYAAAPPYPADPSYAAAPPYQPTPSYPGVPSYQAAPSYGAVPPYQAAVPPYPGGYPGQNYPGAYGDPIQQLAGSAIMALVGRFMASTPGLQNYVGGYNGGYVPPSPPPYAGGAYPTGP